MRRLLHLSALVVLVTVINLVTIALVSLPRASTLGPPPPLENGDCNGDGTRDIADAVYLLGYLFSGGPEPIAIASGPGLTPEQEEILGHMSIEYLDDGQGGTAKTIRLTGVNLQIVNGLGATNGNPASPGDVLSGSVNGLGNLIVGYDESLFGKQGFQPDRTGSHNIVVGTHNSYMSWGGLVVGLFNGISGSWSSVSGGQGNSASSASSSVSGGIGNTASGGGASVSGGVTNEASGLRSSISGGDDNTASGHNSSVSGGKRNIASGSYSSISGGFENLAAGSTHKGLPAATSVSGGWQVTAVGQYDWAAGSCYFCDQ